MKIAFYVYPSAFQAPGGGEILLLKTKEALQDKGISVTLFDQWRDRLKDFDILHVFGSVKECLPMMQAARDVGAKVVLSPIFWSTLQRSLHEYGSFPYKIQMVVRHVVKTICPIVPSARRSMFLVADALMPNSRAEAEQVARLFRIDQAKMHVVPLGADESFACADGAAFTSAYGMKDFILSVGRIEPRKNQLNLIRALKSSGLRLVLIGDTVPAYQNYLEACKKAADKNTVFLPRLAHEDPLLASAYAACDVFVLQGWFETPGLVALEVGLAGARLAVTQHGSTKEYFGDFAEYFSPASPGSIRRAIEKARQRPKGPFLKEHIMTHFLWSHSAEETINVYRHLLK